METPQAYLTLPASAGEPGQRLVGFDRISLEPGQAKRVKLTIRAGASDHPLSYWSTTAHEWTIDAGDYTVRIGGSSRDLPLSGAVSRHRRA